MEQFIHLREAERLVGLAIGDPAEDGIGGFDAEGNGPIFGLYVVPEVPDDRDRLIELVAKGLEAEEAAS